MGWSLVMRWWDLNVIRGESSFCMSLVARNPPPCGLVVSVGGFCGAGNLTGPFNR